MVSAISASNTDFNLSALPDSLSPQDCCFNQMKAHEAVYIKEMRIFYMKNIKFFPITHTILNIQMRKLTVEWYRLDLVSLIQQ